MEPKQKKWLLIAVSLALVVAVLLFVLLSAGKGKGETAAPPPPAPTAMAAVPAPPAPTPPAAEAPAPKPAAPKPPGYRQDPFVPLHPVPRGPDVAQREVPVVLTWGPPAVQVKRLPPGSMASLITPIGTTPLETPKRLVGVMFDGRAFAILDVGGTSLVVKPGDSFEGVKVRAIGRDSVTIVGDDQKEEVLTLSGAPAGSERPAGLPPGPGLGGAAFPLPMAPIPGLSY